MQPPPLRPHRARAARVNSRPPCAGPGRARSDAPSVQAAVPGPPAAATVAAAAVAHASRPRQSRRRPRGGPRALGRVRDHSRRPSATGLRRRGGGVGARGRRASRASPGCHARHWGPRLGGGGGPSTGGRRRRRRPRDRPGPRASARPIGAGPGTPPMKPSRASPRSSRSVPRARGSPRRREAAPWGAPPVPTKPIRSRRSPRRTGGDGETPSAHPAQTVSRRVSSSSSSVLCHAAAAEGCLAATAAAARRGAGSGPAARDDPPAPEGAVGLPEGFPARGPAGPGVAVAGAGRSRAGGAVLRASRRGTEPRKAGEGLWRWSWRGGCLRLAESAPGPEPDGPVACRSRAMPSNRRAHGAWFRSGRVGIGGAGSSSGAVVSPGPREENLNAVRAVHRRVARST